jgi:hypothetical protein
MNLPRAQHSCKVLDQSHVRCSGSKLQDATEHAALKQTQPISETPNKHTRCKAARRMETRRHRAQEHWPNHKGQLGVLMHEAVLSRLKTPG